MNMEDQRNTFEEFNESNYIDNCIDSDAPYIKYWEHPDYIGLNENAKPCYKKHYKCVGVSDGYKKFIDSILDVLNINSIK